MFDADKRRFVEERYPDSELSRRNILGTLLSLSSYEEQWQMDFTLQSLEPLQAAFNQVSGVTFNSAQETLFRFRRYAAWRREQGLPCGDAVDHLVIDTIAAIRRSMVGSPQQLKQVLDYVFDATDMETSDIIYRVFLWMAFVGLPYYETIEVTDKQVDLRNERIYHGGQAYVLPEESLGDFAAACRLTKFYESRGRCFPRVEGDRIMRGKQNKRTKSLKELLATSIRPALSRRFAAAKKRYDGYDEKKGQPALIPLDLTFERVFSSGNFYRIYQRELKGIPIDIDGYAVGEIDRKAMAGKPYAISEKQKRSVVLTQIRTAFREDYNNWKQAFYP